MSPPAVGPTTPPIIFLPGLGADERLFLSQQSAFPTSTVAAWIQPERSESLPAYAARLATTLAITRDTVLAGVSLGGMIALEVARHVPLRGLVLIASCRHPGAIAPSVRRFAEVGLRLPIPNAARRLAPLAIPALGPMNEEHRRLLIDMAESTSMPFLRWGARAIMDWPGVTSAPCPVLHIHGRRDRVIPATGAGADILVAGAGHVVNLTHAPEVNAAIARFVSR